MRDERTFLSSINITTFMFLFLNIFYSSFFPSFLMFFFEFRKKNDSVSFLPNHHQFKPHTERHSKMDGMDEKNWLGQKLNQI